MTDTTTAQTDYAGPRLKARYRQEIVPALREQFVRRRGVPPREELEAVARGVGLILMLLIAIETVIHLVRRRRV